MSANLEHCKECNGKFGSGPTCNLCEAVTRFGLFLRSPRCPREVGRVALGQLREAHRAVLEAAEDHWIHHPEDTAGVGGLRGKAPSLGIPPPASGGFSSGSAPGEERGTAHPPVEAKDSKRSNREEPRLPERGVEDHHRRKHRTHREARSRTRGREKSKRKSRSATPRRVKAEQRSPRSSPREKKRREESPQAAPVAPGPPSPAEAEEPLEEEETEEEEASRSSLDPPVDPGREPRTRERSRPRPPSHSPPRRRWVGPIPSGSRRQTSEDHRPRSHRSESPRPALPRRKKKKKNKGKNKRERQKQWLKENRGGHYRR